MVCKSYKVSVPGSLMLFGEHAVLHGKPAIVVAISQYIHVSLTPRLDRNIQIISSEFGQHLVLLDKFVVTNPYNYVLTAIKQYLKKIDRGFTLNICSDFPATIGFGSSAAVTVATLGLLTLWLEKKSPDLMQLYRQAVKVVRLVQGTGSGADVAASVFGGVISYKMPSKIQKLKNNLPLVAVYSGSKTPTAQVIAMVEKKRKEFPDVFAKLYDAMGGCTENAIKAIKKNELAKLGRLMNIHQGLQDALGVNNAILEKLIFALRTKPNIYGAKISGAGMGDCVIGLGDLSPNTFPKKQFNVLISTAGFSYEK